MLLRKLLAAAAATAVATSVLITPIGAGITNTQPWPGQESWTKDWYCENPYDVLSAPDVLKFTKIEITITGTAAGTDSSTVSGNVSFKDNWDDGFKGYFGAPTDNWAESDYFVNCYGIGEQILTYDLGSTPILSAGGNGGTMLCIAAENKSEFSVDEILYYDADGNVLNIPEPDYIVPINKEVCWTEGKSTGNVKLDLSTVVPATEKITMFGVRVQADYTDAEWQGVGGAISLELSTPIDGDEWYIIGHEDHTDETQWSINSTDGIAYVKIPEIVKDKFNHFANSMEVNVWWGSPIDETATLVELQIFCEGKTNTSKYRYVGDIDDSGETDLSDLSKLTKHVCGRTVLTESQYKNADLNGDSLVNIIDEVILIRIIAQIVEFDPILIDEPIEIGETRNMTSQKIVEDMGIGWNLGNSLESYFDGSGTSDETGWGNPAVTQQLIAKVVDYGFNTIRIPVTWMEHMDASGKVEASWMNRVETVVDYALDEGVYVILNVHHDGGGDGDTEPWIRNIENSSQYNAVMTKFKSLWTQIAERFQNKSDYLILEGINEIGFDNLYNSNPKQAFTLVNDLNKAFVETVRATGGNNPYRHLLIGGYWTDINKTCEMLSYVTLPDDPRIIMSVHYYTPYEFCIKGSTTTWGSSADISLLRTYFGKMKTNFVDAGIPVIIGEYGFGKGVQAASACTFVDTVCSVAVGYGMCPVLWDNGEVINRKTYDFLVSGLKEVIAKH